MENKSLFYRLAETYEAHRAARATETPPSSRRALTWLARQLMPNLGSVLLVFVLLTVFPGLAAPLTGLNATSISTIPYQGRLADASGNPVTGKQNMEFRIYNVPTGGTPLWEEFWTGANSVDVSDGLFSVMLGSINTGLTAVVQGNTTLYLGITVGTDSEMTPRVQLGSVPFSIWSLTVADGSVTAAKLANNAVTSAKVVDGTLTTVDFADKVITSRKLAVQQGRVELQNTQLVTVNDTWGYAPIPGLSFNLDLATPSAVLVWYTVSAEWLTNGDNRIAICYDNSCRVWNEQFVGSAGVRTSTHTQVLDLSAGSHSISLQYKAQYAGSQVNVFGQFSSIGYVVLGSE